MYIVIKTDGACSDKDWEVCALFADVREASKFAWTSALIKFTHHDFYVKYWCDTSNQAKNRRLMCGGYGPEYHILDWNMDTNMLSGTWFLETKSFLLELGEKGEFIFIQTIHKFMDVLAKYVPGKLWNECMVYDEYIEP